MSRYFNTLDRYLFGQLSLTVLFGVVLFSIIWLAPVTLFDLIQALVAGDISAMQAFTLYLYHIPAVLGQTIPIATLIGSIFVFQRMSRNFELVAIFASGISTIRLMRSALLVGVIFGTLHFFAQEVVNPIVSPKLDETYRELKLKDISDRNFVFVEKNHQDQLEKFFLIGQIQKKNPADFIVLYYQNSDAQSVAISRILRAKTGYWNYKTNQWLLIDGIEYVLNNEGVYKEIRKFEKQQVRTSKYAARLLKYTQLNPMSMDWLHLQQYIGLLQEGEQWQDVPFFKVRLYQKMIAPVASIIFLVLGCLLGMERVRTNRTYGLVAGAVVIFSYSILVPLSTNLASMGILLPFIMAWVPLAVAIGATAVIVKIR